jgi:5'-methylthioadenosine phosphorylase
MKIGVLGGSGLYDLEGIGELELVAMDTPFGAPSDDYACGMLNGVEVCFLPRHGVGHRLLPSEINHRANIMGFKMLGCERIVSVSAVGSLRENIHPRDILLPDQYFDRTKRNFDHTFFGEGIGAHVAFGEPCCPCMRQTMADALTGAIAAQGDECTTTLHVGGTYVNMEGPAFSTKAESNVYRSFGFDVIGMTSLAEAKLSREAEICYQAMAMVTDYDCWHESEEDVSVDMVIAHLLANAALARQALGDMLPKLGHKTCRCEDALAQALITQPDAMPEATKEKLAPIIGKYVG